MRNNVFKTSMLLLVMLITVGLGCSEDCTKPTVEQEPMPACVVFDHVEETGTANHLYWFTNTGDETAIYVTAIMGSLAWDEDINSMVYPPTLKAGESGYIAAPPGDPRHGFSIIAILWMEPTDSLGTERE